MVRTFSSARVFVDRDADRAGKRFFHILAPLHGADAAAREIIFPADVEEVVGGIQTVHVKVEQRHPAAEIFVDDGIRRAGDLFGHAEPRGKAARKRGLARAKVAIVGNDVPRQ